MIALGDKIQRLRVWRGLTQTELASGLVTPSMISQIEGNKANPSTELLLQIIKRLGVSVETFFKDVYFDLGGRAMYRFALDLMEHEQYGAAFQFLKQLEDRPSVVESNELKYQTAICLQNTGKIKEAIDRLDEILLVVQVEGDREFHAKILNQLAESYYKLHNLSLAHFYSEKANSIFDTLPEADKYAKARAKSIMGVVSSKLGEYNKSLGLYQAAYELYFPDYPARAATMLMNMGIQYKNLGQYEKAEEYYLKSMDMFRNLPLEKNSILVKHNYGVLVGLTGKYEKALDLLKECLVEFKEHKFLDMLPSVLEEMAIVELNRGNLTEAKAYALQGIESANGDHYTIPYLKKVLAQICYKNGQIKEAVNYLEEAIPLFQKYSRIGDLIKTLPFLSKCYQELGNVERAVTVLENSKMYAKKLF
ncbi:tetratricopeptide repeat protein [Effusibacillus lacus]|uniref:HTH cro/C1-type domain-containing protein n=1 Tax=Effusibacillus lacus TaxID=1348429 RepID=A0A292YLF2_9BACL|nr:tetratricopeptide repeat protein [Effusibacillus lacus]TCS74235.1 DNA-binding XRE family transcriptional regulator [Effusibacillus lacus]GAX90768.1 hypothetical protein EFBL_2409 [Effusibacillus lacus]